MASDTVIIGYESPADEIRDVRGTPIHGAWTMSSRGNVFQSVGSVLVAYGTWGAGTSHASESLQEMQHDVTPASVHTNTADFAWFEGYLLHKYSAGLRVTAASSSREGDPSSLVRYIQQSAGLSVSEIARLVGVSRRTIHNWREGGGIASANHERLVELLDAIRPMADTWGPHRTNVWIQTSRLSSTNKPILDELDTAVEEALRADEIPVLVASPAHGDEEFHDVSPITQSELSAALAAFTRPRAVEDRHEWTPRELAWSPPETDDD